MSRAWRLPGFVAGSVALLAAGPALAQNAEAGRLAYEKWCGECHGAEGLGDGPAADHMLPRPRDFSQARYQIRTTGSGELPTDEDITRAIREGLPGTTMPGWPNLSNREVQDLVAYVKSFSRFFAGPPPEPMEFSADPGGGAEALESGRRAYEALECFRCHGQEGRGDGESAPTLEDWRELPIRAADLTEAWTFNGGTSATAIHARVLTGLDGTPMPAAIDAMNSGVVSPEEVWHLAHYVVGLGPREMPRVRDVVRVHRLENTDLETLPTSPGDEGWERLEAFYFPLAGQVIEAPRNFAPTVDGMWVQGVHDGASIALRLRWNDPSRSPDPRWDEWQEKILGALNLDGAEPPEGRPPDAFALQLPFEVPEGTERPYFLMGDAREPAYLWRWESEGGASEARARGLGAIEPLDGGELEAEASWEHGRWTLVLRRPLEAGEERLALRAGTAIPAAFFAWDGSSGEIGKRGSISTWYYLFLEEPASSRVVVAPLVAVLLTGGLGLFLVRRAQSTARGA